MGECPQRCGELKILIVPAPRGNLKPGYKPQFALHTLVLSLILKLFPEQFLDFGP
jgi:hypothetical protein